MPDYRQALNELKGLLYGADTDPGPPDAASRMQFAQQVMQDAMPEESAAMRSLKPMSWADRTFSHGALANTYPGRSVRYNPALVPDDQGEANDLLAHELTHVRQWGRPGAALRSLGEKSLAYWDRPEELEAQRTEQRRQSKRRDVPLTPEPPLPTFSMKGR